MQKITAILIGLLLVLGAGWFLFSTYLVSKLDGTGGVTAPQSDLTAYESEHFGLSFQYRNVYVATTTHAGNGEREWHVLLLLPEGYVPPQGGEGPAAITVQDIPNPEGVSLEQWVKSDNRSNWKLDGTEPQATTIGGKPALTYRHSGLFEFDAAAVAHNGKIYLFEAGWMAAEDKIRTDFAKLLSTVQFL